jgi:hypothetical protein
VNPPLEEITQPLAEQRSHPGLTRSQHRSPEKQHPPNHGAGQGLAHPGGMAADEILLQLADGVGVDTHLGQGSEPGIDAVHAGRIVSACGNRLDDGPGPQHPLAPRVRQDHQPLPPSHLFQRGQVDRLFAELERTFGGGCHRRRRSGVSTRVGGRVPPGSYQASPERGASPASSSKMGQDKRRDKRQDPVLQPCTSAPTLQLT